MLYGKCEHGFDRKGRSFRGIEGVRGMKKRRREIFAFLDNAVGTVQDVSTVDLRDVPRFCAEKGLSLMSWHMESGHTGELVFRDKIRDRCSHASSDSATCIITAHSILFLKSSQPYS